VRRDETHTCVNNHDLETIRWELDSPATETAVHARREGAFIEVAGMVQGEAVHKTWEIDEAPWYQAMTLSLQPFAVSSQATVEYWTMRPDTLTVHKVKAEKEDVELVRAGKEEIEAQRVRVSLTGLKSCLWHCFYWYATGEGTFLKHEGSFGLPGLPHKTIVFVEALE
jgi:hypothetical protein